MSSRSPHRRPNTRSDADLDEIISSNPALQAHLAKTPQISERHDLPDGSGYSKTTDTVYIDRHLARAAPEIDGKPYKEWREAMVDYEWMAKGLAEILHYKNDAAHQLASLKETRTLRRIGIKPFIFHKTLKPFVKRAALEKVSVPPRDLDVSSFKDHDDDKAILTRLRDTGVHDAGAKVPLPEKVAPEPAHDTRMADLLVTGFTHLAKAMDRLTEKFGEVHEELKKQRTINVLAPHPKKVRKRIRAGRDKFGNMLAEIEEVTGPEPGTH